MLKLNISYPNGIIVSLECNDPHAYPDLMASLRQYLTVDSAINGRSASNIPAPVSDPGNSISAHPQAAREMATKPTPPAAVNPQGTTGAAPYNDPKFIDFCKMLSPNSDMKRVIVAAEGAKQLLNINQISPEELQDLLRTLQWPQPEKLVLTLRNAARSSYRWLQRVPGRRGYYTVTEQGRMAIMPKAPALS